MSKSMPILGRIVDGCPSSIPFDALTERWAQNNHGQSLSRLAERGGLSLTEVAANIEERRWRSMTDDELREALKALKTVCTGVGGS